MSPQIEVVKAWHDAVNAGNADRIATLVHEDVEVGGPRGSGYGTAILQDWVERAGIQLEPGRYFQRGDEGVVKQRAGWRLPETDEASVPAEVASCFLVRVSRVRSIKRYPDLGAALEAAGMDEANEVPEFSNAR